jgi:tRNA 2-thiouridine synthesizing protein A
VGVRHTETSLIIWAAAQSTDAPAATANTTLITSDNETPPVSIAATDGAPASLFSADHFYDAGDLGCAYGPLDTIAKMMRGLASGQTIEIRATDPTVAFDLAAWCRMTGHTLADQQADRYLVRRK